MNNQSKVKILTKNTTWIYISKIFTQLFGFIVTIFVIRKLAVETWGTYNFLLSSFIIFRLLGLSPFLAVFNRYIPEIIQNREYNKLKKIIIYGLVLSVIAIFIVLIGVYNFRMQYGEFFNIENFKIYFLSFMLYVCAESFYELVKAILTSLLLHKHFSIITILGSIFSSLALIYFLPSLNVITLLSIRALLVTFYFIAATFVLLRYYKSLELHVNKTHGTPVTFKRVARYGLFSSVNELGAGIVGKTSDYFIIAAIGNPYYIGLYAFAFKLYSLIYKILPLADFKTIIKPLFFQKFSEDYYNKDEFVQIFNFMIKVLLPIFLFPTLYFFIFGKAIITYIYDPKYLEAYWVACIIMLSNVFIAFYYPLGFTIQLKERVDISLYSKIVVVFSITAGIIGMKFYNILGVAIATTIGDLLKYIFMYILIRNKADIVYKFYELKNYLFISANLILIFYFTQSLINNIWKLICISIIFAGITVVLLIIFHPFNHKDIIMVKRISESSKIIKLIKPFVVKISQLKPGFI